MPAEHARGVFKLSEPRLQDSDDSEEARQMRDEAEYDLLRRDLQAVDLGKRKIMIDGC